MWYKLWPFKQNYPAAIFKVIQYGFSGAVVKWHHYCTTVWRRGVVVTTTAQLHSTKPELSFCAGSNPARGVLEIRDGEDLWQWSRLEIRINAFCRSTIPRKQFIIIIIIIIIIINIIIISMVLKFSKLF